MRASIEDGHLALAVNLLPVLSDPVSEAERITQLGLCVYLHRTRFSQRTFSNHQWHLYTWWAQLAPSEKRALLRI